MIQLTELINHIETYVTNSNILKDFERIYLYDRKVRHFPLVYVAINEAITFINLQTVKVPVNISILDQVFEDHSNIETVMNDLLPHAINLVQYLESISDLNFDVDGITIQPQLDKLPDIAAGYEITINFYLHSNCYQNLNA